MSVLRVVWLEASLSVLCAAAALALGLVILAPRQVAPPPAQAEEVIP